MTCYMPGCPHGSMGNTGMCEDHALQVFDAVIEHKGYGYMLARADGVVAAAKYAQEHKMRYHDPEHDSNAWKTRPGWIYYIRVGDRIKIGFAENVAGRTRAYPPTSELLATHPGTWEMEQQIHRKFNDLLAEGNEWFHPSERLLEHIEDVLTKFPDQQAGHKFRKNIPTTVRKAE